MEETKKQDCMCWSSTACVTKPGNEKRKQKHRRSFYFQTIIEKRGAGEVEKSTAEQCSRASHA
jgi:hypothetical protein